MLVRSRVIVLRCVRYSDDALIADVLSEETGRVAFMVRVSRSPRAAVRHSLFTPLALLEMEWEHRPAARLMRPRQARAALVPVSLPYDARKTGIVLFLAEVLHYAVRGEPDSRDIFEYVYRSVEWLDVCRQGFANFHLVFLLHLTRFLGFAPNVEEGVREGAWFDLAAGCFTERKPPHSHCLPPADAALLPLLMRMRFRSMHVFRFSGAERNRLLGRINEYFRLHLPAFPELKSLPVLHELFAD